MKTFLFLILTWALVVNSLKPSRYSEWSIQRGIEDFVLNEVTDEVYVAATFLFHLDADLNTVSMFESNEITATNVIVSHASNTGFACSDLTGHCFLFNLTDVSEINGFEGTPFISASSASFPIDDMAILFLTLRGSESICFVLADERTGSIAYRLLIYPSFQFTTDSLSLPSFQEQFLGVPTGMPLRRSLSSYSLRGFVYFVNRHNDGTDFPLYVMRMCEDEDSSAIRISSLIEVRLTPCVASKKYPHHVVFGNLDNIYGEVLLVTFTTGELDMDSNVCVYTQLDIEITMNTTIQSCFDNSTDVSFIFPWFDTVSYPCSLGMPQSTCKLCLSQDDTICRLYNYTGIPGVELVGYNHSEYGKATALTLLSFDEVDLVFVGNDVGDLYKFQLVNYGSITLIEDINLSNLLNEAFSKLIPASDCIYASRATLLYRVTLDNCNDYTTCQSCVDTIDPVCGYCSLTDTCTRKSDCASPDLSLRWITDNSSLCLSVNSIAPSLAQTGEDIELTLSIDNLPKLQPTEYYECVFVSSRTPVSRVTTLSGVSLAITGPDTPGESLAYCNTSTSFVIASDYEVINFSLYSTELNENFSFQEDSFTFYDCNKHSRCESCADSTAPCFWCVYDNICSHSDALCNLGYVEPNQNSTYCPAITNTTGHVHNGDRSVDVLELHTVNTVEPIIGFNYTCVYVYADNTSDVSDAVWMSEYRIDCDPPDSTYSQFNALLVGFFLVWGGDGFEINEDAINVTIFNCTRYSQSCSSCLGFGGEFGCGNCYQNPNRTGEPVCSLRGRCVDTFYDNTQPCPSAQITDFVPKSSHVFGGTFVNITGSDFGGNLDEIEVTVANEACEISFYDFRTRIDCVTQPSTEGNTGPIIVTVKGIPTQSDSNYTYSLPNITDVRTTPFPETNSLSDTLYGVKEGGTELVLYGTNLGIGSERNVFIQDIFPCVITDLGTTSITCETTEINNLETGIVSVRIDGYELRFQSGLFSYVNLEVSLTEDRFITPAGGFIVRVDVSDVRGLHAPYLEVFDALTSDTVNKPCEGLDVDEVVCESPAYSYSSNLSVYFVVDNLRRDLQGITPAANNPNCTQTYISRNNIIIQGMNFDLANAEDYVITTESPGGIILPCRIVTIATEKLECNPPEIITGTLTVKIGRSIECTFPVETNIFEQYGIYIVGSSSLFLLIVLTACPLILSIFVIRHYKRKKVREVKHLLNQYSKLESNIAKECKTGFAELQVEIVDFVQAAETNTIPFTDFQTYVIRLFFSKNQSVEFLSHPPTDPKQYGEEIETFRRAMKLFQELLNNKEFLIEFIRTLDNSSNLEVNEKSYFASLIMIALHKNLFFATEILKVLIDDLINKGVTTSRQTIKTLFRSTSIGEKLLSHWLALCMFNYSRGLAGEELYNLYSALKVQINKGPIDAVTGEAKYSLNQDNILRTTFEVKEVEMLCYFGDVTETTKLLDCDTIGQAKKKIIDTLNKNMLASEKPDPEDHELIYIKPKEVLSPVMKSKSKQQQQQQQHGDDPTFTLAFQNPIYTPGDDTVTREIPTMSKVKQPYLLFRDIDKTSGLDVGWRRINSLKHYFDIYNIFVPEKGSLLLVLQSDLRERFPSLYSDIMKRKSTDTPTRIFHFSIPGSSVNSTLERGKVISEVYFTKLLSTKAILQRFIDNMVNSIFPERIAQQDCPNAIKHLFDFLDDRARMHNITDPEIVHTWKNNSVVLRFWVNMLKNPHFLLDIDIAFPVESSLSTIAQGLIDSCSAREEELTKDSPANKLLFAKDTRTCRKRVRKYYEDIQSIHQTQANFNQHLRQMQLSNSPFFVESAVQEIFLQFVAGISVVGNLMKRLKEQNLESQVTKFIQILNMTPQIPGYEEHM